MLEELLDAGATSLKIEGRLKELFYSDVNAGIGAFYKIQIPNKNLKSLPGY